MEKEVREAVMAEAKEMEATVVKTKEAAVRVKAARGMAAAVRAMETSVVVGLAREAAG